MPLLALCPSRGRPAEAAATLASFLEQRRDPASRLVFIVDSDDPSRRSYPPANTHVVQPGGNMGAALGQAARDKALLADATSVGMIGDDNRFASPGFDLELDAWLTANVGIAYGDDGFQHDRLPTSWWLSRPIVDALGMAHPEIRHFYMDNYWLELGRAAGVLSYFPDVKIEHLHPLAHKAKWDPIYTRGHANAVHDKAWFERWREGGLRRDLATLERVLGKPVMKDKRRVLADWHHPALWESLRILFEDRFGWELYSPIGLGWAESGMWRLRHNGWLESDYLEQPRAKLVDGSYELSEPQYPEHPRKLVTVEQAAAIRWDYVLASVPVHQRSFATFAKRVGARFIHQVGNAVHAVDSGIPQIVLASSNAARRIRGAVFYHQEFDRKLFSYTPVKDRARVSSVMLRLDTVSCDYGWLATAAGVKWSAIGGQDERAPTYVASAAKVAEVIRTSGWIWQDKRIGDGYGHALHNAAAMGRPLIGHASHYKDQLGEPFWRDLDTCIDLDRHPPERALRLFRAISADPAWHRAMSDELVATFNRLVDFDAEAEHIYSALTADPVRSGLTSVRRRREHRI